VVLGFLDGSTIYILRVFGPNFMGYMG
jgi:hypothetical protein